MSHHDRLFAARQTATTSFPGPVWNSARQRFLSPPPSMEPPANRTQADAFHASLQAFLENVLVPDCLLWDRTIKLDSVVRHRCSCVGGAQNQLLSMSIIIKDLYSFARWITYSSAVHTVYSLIFQPACCSRSFHSCVLPPARLKTCLRERGMHSTWFQRRIRGHLLFGCCASLFTPFVVIGFDSIVRVRYIVCIV